MAETTLREYIETKLTISGFALDQALEGRGLKVWPRGKEPAEASFVIAEKDGFWQASSGVGLFKDRKRLAFMTINLKSWCEEYKNGAR